MTDPPPLLLDSSVLIAHQRPNSDPEVFCRVEEAILDRRAATCAVVVAEVLAGARTTREYAELMFSLSSLKWLETTDECWLRAAALGFNLRRQGLTVPLTDRLVLAISRVHEVELLHCDAHYDIMAEVADEVA
jgi:predicted nucleic acid-binding protein